MKTPPDPKLWPTCERLALVLEEFHAPQHMIDAARMGQYHDFLSDSAVPELDLLNHARTYGLQRVVDGVMEGEWDATKEESDQWAASPDGQQTMSMLTRRPQ